MAIFHDGSLLVQELKGTSISSFPLRALAADTPPPCAGTDPGVGVQG